MNEGEGGTIIHAATFIVRSRRYSQVWFRIQKYVLHVEQRFVADARFTSSARHTFDNADSARTVSVAVDKRRSSRPARGRKFTTAAAILPTVRQ